MMGIFLKLGERFFHEFRGLLLKQHVQNVPSIRTLLQTTLHLLQIYWRASDTTCYKNLLHLCTYCAWQNGTNIQSRNSATYHCPNNNTFRYMGFRCLIYSTQMSIWIRSRKHRSWTFTKFSWWLAIEIG